MPQVTGRASIEGVLVDWVVEQPAPALRLPVALLDRAQTAAELQRVQAVRARLAAYEAELVLGLADDSPDTFDPPPDHPGARKPGWAADGLLPGVSEFFSHELAIVLNCGRGTASYLAERAWTWRASLPATWVALAAGELDEPRAKALAEVLAVSSPEIARSVEAQLLPEATGLSLGTLKRRALELVLTLDAGAADVRREQAQRAADVRTYPSHLDGMSTLAAELPTPVSAECFDLVDQLASMLKADGDPRPVGELRAAVLADLIRRPWDVTLPAVAARLIVTAPLQPRWRFRRARLGQRSADHRRPRPRAAHPARGAGRRRAAGSRGRFADAGPHRRRRAAARHGHTGRAPPSRPPWLPRPPGRRLLVLRAGPATGNGLLRADRRPAHLGHDPRPDVSLPGLRAARRLGRPRPRDRAFVWRAHRLQQSLLPLPEPPSPEDLRPRLALRDDRRRHAPSDHALRDHPRDPPTRTPAMATRDTRAPRTTRAGHAGRAPRATRTGGRPRSRAPAAVPGGRSPAVLSRRRMSARPRPAAPTRASSTRPAAGPWGRHPPRRAATALPVLRPVR